MIGNAIVRGVIIPLVILGCALGLFLVAGMRGSIGPLDLAAVNWIAGIQWVVAPVAGGLIMAGLGQRPLRVAAIMLGALSGLCVAFFLLTGAETGTATCAVEFGANAIASAFGCLTIGAIVGSGMGGSLYLTASSVRRGQLWLGAAIGAAANLFAGLAAYMLFYSLVRCL